MEFYKQTRHGHYNSCEDVLIISYYSHRGFFSHCSLRLFSILQYYHLNNKKLPGSIIDSFEYNEYFQDNEMNIEIPTNKDYLFTWLYQFEPYKDVIYSLTPFLEKYFSISKDIEDIIQKIEQEYNLDYENLCVLFYRGNNKHSDTDICDYRHFLDKTKEEIRNPDIRFLIQSDEYGFIIEALTKFPNQSFYFKNYIKYLDPIDKSTFVKNDVQYSKYFLAITIIMSRCKYIVCTSSNTSMWIMLFRGNTQNIIQYLYHRWYTSI